MKKVFWFTFFLMAGAALFGAEPITGLWKSVDDTTGLPKSISLIYEHGGVVYGRILATFDEQGQMLDSIMNPVEKAVNVAGEPYYSGLDFIWDMEDRGRKWSRGKIMDPEPAKVYSCDMWIEKGNLIVRGKIGPFGRNQEWLPATVDRDLPAGFVLPRTLVPSIPEPK
ncbi:MAG: DUF2147 domain-containing protein [Spirochaetales bacterium]|nr:DUF2147 domain-containing protein [Spirochaetales bacterium]